MIPFIARAAISFVFGAIFLPLFSQETPHASLRSAPGWYSVPDSKLQSVCPADTKQYDFAGGCRYVIAAWNSGIADMKRERMLMWGGGHSDYAGNEMYAFDLKRLRMERLNDPSPINTSPKCLETLSDGKPNARHTYGGLAYIAHADRLFSFGGSLNVCGNFSSATWTLDLETLQWKDMNPEGGRPGNHPGVIADYDPNSRSVFLHDTDDLWQYDYDKNRYKRLEGGGALDYHMNGVIDPKRKIFFIMGASGTPGGGLKAISIAPGKVGSQDWTGKASKTCGPLLKSDSPGLAYDSAIDRVVGWPNFGDTIYIFDPDTRSCTTETFSGGPPDSGHQGSPHTSNGTFGRFRYFPEKDVFVLVNQAGSNTFLLRLSSSKTTDTH